MSKRISTQYDHAKIPIVGLVPESLSSAPASPVNGQLWYDTTANRFKVYENGSWVLSSLTGAELLANKGAASGYASLDSGTKVPIAELPTGSSSSTVCIGNDSRLSDTRTPTDGTVTSAKIVDGAIVVGDLNAALLDAADGTTSLRMLGYTSTKAMPGVARLDQIAAPTAAVGMNGQKITGGAAGTSSTDFVILSQLDAASAGIDNKPSARIVAVAQRALTGLAAIDGVTPVASDRVLLTAQTDPVENGIWVAASGAWARAADTITSASFWMVEEGTTYGGSQWKVATANPITVGTTALTINQFGAAGTVYTGTTNRISLSGSAIDIDAAYVGQTSITTLGTIATGTWSGTAVAVAKGGTGSTTAAGARTNLSAAGKYTETYTTAIVAGTPFTITHGLNTQAVTVSLRNTSTNQHEDFLIIANAANTITVTSDVAYASPSYEITVIG